MMGINFHNYAGIRDEDKPQSADFKKAHANQVEFRDALLKLLQKEARQWNG